MTPEDRARLRGLADAVPADDRWRDFPPFVVESQAVRAFIHAASPTTVEGLLDALDAAEKAASRAASELSEMAARAGRAEGALGVREAQRDAVLKLHMSDEVGLGLPGDAICYEDGCEWPCPTARALGVES